MASAASFENEGVARVVTSFSDNPDDPDLFGDDSETGNKFLLREVAHLRFGGWRVETNGYALMAGSSNKSSPTQIILEAGEERNRNSRFERHWHNSDTIDGYLTLDRLNLKGGFGPLKTAIGRFPVNMSVTTIYTPNDLFAPFRAHNFYREYKPGVDALKFTLPLGQKGKISALGVAGYKSDALIGRDPKNHNRFTYEDSSAMGQISYTLLGFDFALLGGKFGLYDLIGFSLQGELFDSLGLRAEGHQKEHRHEDRSNAEMALGFDFRITDELLCQLEQFSHGAGYATRFEYLEIEDDPEPPIYFLGQNYTGVALSYDVSPLTNFKSMVSVNHTDSSALVSSSLVHSLTENTEITGSLMAPYGKGPSEGSLRSEYGTYPKMFKIEAGMYW